MAFSVEPAAGRGKSNKRKRLAPAMNVTPLVDIVLVLLIVFMMITPLMAKQISVNVPVKPDPNEPEPGPGAETQVVLRVGAEGQAFVNAEAVPDAEIPGKLKRVFAARRDQTLFFDAADSLSYGRAVEVLDIARGAGLVTIAVLTEELTE